MSDLTEMPESKRAAMPKPCGLPTKNLGHSASYGMEA